MQAGDPLHQLLAQVKVRVKAMDLSALALVCVAALALYLFGAALCDRFLVLDKSIRFALFWLLLGLVTLAGSVLIYYGNWHLNDLYVAQLIQRGNPELKDMLIAQVALRSGEAALHPVLHDALLVRLQACAPNIRSSGVVPRKWLALSGYLLLSVGLFFFSSASFSEGSFWTCLRRVVMPWRDILPPTRTQIAEVQPGNARAQQGSVVEILARTQGERPESVCVVFSRDAGLYYTELQPAGENLWRTRLSCPAGELTYYLIANDTKSDRYTLRGVSPPIIQSISVRLKQPEYTGLGQKLLSGGHVDALAGSTAIVRATISKPVAQAALQLSWGERVPLYVMPPEVAASAAVPASLHVIEGQFVVSRSGAYRIELTDTDGLLCQAPCDYDVRARLDEPPTVTVLEPNKDLHLACEDPFKLLVSARDDYGVAALTLVYHIRSGPQVRRSLGEYPNRRDVLRPVEFALKELKLLPGDELYYYVEVCDSLRPTPHKAVSQVYRLKVKPEYVKAAPGASYSDAGSGLKKRGRGEQLVKGAGRRDSKTGDRRSGRKGSGQREGAGEKGRKGERDQSDEGEGEGDDTDEGEGEGEGAGEDDGSGEGEGEGNGDGDGDGGGDGDGDGDGEGAGEGDGEGDGEGEGEGEGEGDGKGKAGGAGKGGKPNNGEPGEGSGGGGSAGGSGGKPNSGGGGELKDAPEYFEKTDPAKRPAGEKGIKASGKVNTGNVEHEVKRGALDDQHFTDDGVKPQEAAKFGEKFRAPDKSPRVPEDERHQGDIEWDLPEIKIQRQVREGSGSDVAPLRENTQGELGRDEVKGLLQNHRAKVDPEYRELLEEYYKALAK